LRGPFDFVAASVALEDVWYIIPANEVTGMNTGKKSMGWGSDSGHAKHEQCCEAWHLLRQAMAVGEDAESTEADVPPVMSSLPGLGTA
jgi:hypothetical protein